MANIPLFKMWLLLLLFSIAACGKPDAQSAQRQAAIDRAVEFATHSHPGLNGSEVAPLPVAAQQMTLAMALQRPEFAGVQPKLDLTMPVWVVTLEGLWRSGMPGGSVGQPAHHMTIMLDARTNQEIMSVTRP